MLFYRRRNVLLSLLLLLPATLPKAAPLVLSEKQPRVTPGAALEYCRDRSGRLSITNFLDPRLTPAMTRSPSLPPNFGFSRDVIWVRIQVKNNSTAASSWLLEYSYPMVDNITFHLAGRQGLITSRQTGRLFPFATRELKHRHFVFRIPLPPGESGTILLRLQSGSNIPLPLTLWETAAFHAADHELQLLLGIFYGTILIMIIYNLLLLISFRDMTYLHYILFLVCISVVQGGLHGLAYEYLWPNLVWWNSHSFVFFTAVAIFWICLFLQAFLFTKRNHPRLHRLLLVQESALLACGLGGFILPYSFSVQLVSILAVLSFVLILGTGIRSLHQGFRAARFYLLAWTCFLTGGVLLVLRNFGVLPHTFLTINGMQLGIMALVLFLSLALSDRIIVLRKEHEKLAALEQELTIARIVQSTILTTRSYLDSITFLEIDIQYLPMNNDVSGDYFNVSLIPETGTTITIADASGHGLQAALTTMQIDMLHKESQSATSPCRRLEYMNNLWFRKKLGHNFFSCFTADIGPETLRFASGGHPAQYLLSRERGRAVPLVTRGPLLGVSHNPVFTDGNERIRPGDILILYTDGLCEEFDRAGNEYGEERLLAVLDRLLQEDTDALTAQEISACVLEDVARFRGGAPLNDDITLIAIRLK